jgi:hypothetical protein
MRAYHQAMRRMRWGLIAIVTTGLVTAAMGAAASAAVLAPPGHAGANQYFETIPTSRGNAAPPGSVHGSGNAHAGSQRLAGFGQGASTDAKLAQLGKTGQAAAALAAATAPAPASASARNTLSSGRSASRGAGASGGASADGRSSGTGSVASGIAHALTGSDTGGLGLALPLLLLTALLVVVGLLVTRVTRRAGSTPPSS